MPHVDLNSDLGESFGAWTMGDDAAMLPLVSSANLACGFHAGDPLGLLAACRTALAHGVTIGAHPSYRDRVGFGRRDMEVAPEELGAELLYQVGALVGVAESIGARVAYVKPHGALYTRMAVDPVVADVVAEAAATLALPVLGPPLSAVETACSRAGVRFVREAFADRAYLADGTLAPRGLPGAVITDPAEVADRAERIVADGEVTALDGSTVSVRVDSLCVHGDTVGAVQLAHAVREALTRAGVTIAAFA
ncbi:MAG: LamB/YcsF family protein [Actinobacteria bacterium]|nr:LamB/YcsF family protein [Actinomycetota bacterium]MBU1608056.1 LamB/YcsF family protein [Actinomycetota bacterium]MBU2315762.1 LamB/YcsF family protein [Actinomycetota bacterium]MBU2384458.1 LamB/YcsF family protein [Actinomycetota bacterium]